MADRYLLVDDATGAFKRGNTFNDTDTYYYQDFDSTGQSTFILTNTFLINQLMDVTVNGSFQREGGSFDFTRNVGAHSITFNSPVPSGAWVRTKLLNPGAIITPSTEDFDVGVGGETEFESANVFTGGSTMEVYYNGILQREGVGKDFERNVGMQKIVFASTVPQDAWVRIRLY